MSWDFHGDCIESVYCFWQDGYFYYINLAIHEHGTSFHLLRSSSISFFKDLKFLSYKSFTCLVRVISRYFILFVAIVKGMQMDPFLSPCTKLKSKWIKNLHIKPDTLKLIEKKLGESIKGHRGNFSQ